MQSAEEVGVDVRELANDSTTPTVARRTTRSQRRLLSESGIITILSFGAYLAVAMLLDFKYYVFPGDAMARMANGFYVLFSRDPHLGAIGFVWTPLTSILDLFFLLFKGIWPALATHDVAGSLTSVCAMAASVYQVRAILADWGVPRTPRILLVALFALNPMIMYYAANGMSEAVYVFTLTAATRYLLRWIRDQDSTRSLVYAAIMLALAFLGRNEAVASAGLGTALVMVLAFEHSTGTRHHRVMAAATDGTVFVTPFAVTFAAWAISGYVLTHQLLAQFQVNALQVSIAGIRLQSATSRLMHEFHALSYIGPLLPIALVLAVVVALKRHDSQPWAIVCILGGALAFSLVSYVNGSIFPWFRFYILVVPIEVLFVGYVLSPGRSTKPERIHAESPQPSRNGSSRPQTRGRTTMLVSAVGVLAALVIVGPSLPATAKGMFNPIIGPEENQDLGFIFHRHLTAEDIDSKHHYAHVLSISQFIGRMHLPDGSVVTDDSVECVPEIVVTSPKAKVFVIPNDRDFDRILADPLTFHAHFMLVPAPVGLSAHNAINQEYPNIYRASEAFVRVAHSFPGTGNCPAFHLLRVVGYTS